MLELLNFMTKKQFKTAGFLIGVGLPIFIIGAFLHFMSESSLGIYTMQWVAVLFGIGITISILLGWGQVFANIKTSSLRKAIHTSNIRKRDFFIMSFIASFIMFVVVFAILILSLLILMSTGIIHASYYKYRFSFINPIIKVELGTFEYLSKINWGLLIGGMLNSYVTAATLAFFITSISETQNKYQTITWSYMIFAVIFTGLVIPVDFLRLPIEDTGNVFENVMQYSISFIAWLLPTSFTNFYLSDVMQLPLWNLTLTNSTNPDKALSLLPSYWNSFNFNLNWWVPMIYNSFFALGGLYWVRHWN